MATAAPQGIEIASARKFGDFKAREGSPAARYHEIFEISNFDPTLTLQNLNSKNFSGTPQPNHNHQHMPLNKLTGGYGKRLSGFRAGSKNVTKMPENYVHRIFASRPHRLQYYLDGGNRNRLYKSYTIRNDHGGAATH